MLLKNIIYTVLSIQEKFLRMRLAKTLGAKNLSKRKRHFAQGCLLDLNSLADVEKNKLEEEMKLLLKKYDFEPFKILEYIQNQGTRVYFLQNASKILNSIGENEGFIYPAKGFRAIYLALNTCNKFKTKTDEMFILPKGNINKYYFLYHFYNWYAFKHNINGISTESQYLLNKYLYGNNDTKSLQLSEIYQLKDAIKQDKAAIEFVVKLCRESEGAQKALEKLKNDGAKI